MSKSKVVAEVSFEYKSRIKTERLREQQKLQQTRRVFTIDDRSYDGFIRAMKCLDEQMENFTSEHTLTEAGREWIMEFVKEFTAANVMRISWQDVAILIGEMTPIDRARIFQECISLLIGIAKDGVLPESIFFSVDNHKSEAHVIISTRDGNAKNVRSFDSALRYARTHIMSLDVDGDVAGILFNIVRQGIKPNVVYDQEGSKSHFAQVLGSIKPVLVRVRKGDVILESGMEIDDEVSEMLSEYQKRIREVNRIGYGIHSEFYPKMLLGTIALYAVMFLVRLIAASQRPTLRTLASCGVLAIVQLLSLRLFIQIGEWSLFEKDILMVSALCFFPPALCAAGIAALMYGIIEGTIVGTIVSAYYTLMSSRNIEFFFTLLLVHFLFLSFLRNVNFRVKIVRAGGMSAMIIFVVILVKNFIPQAIDRLAIMQSCAMAAMCITSSILVLAFLPIFEKLFSTCSNVALLELTDYNHPLLKSLQVSTPGTYHHSLVVSNIAEQVAILINANSALCKTGALYHDIGKMSKPEYFVENQGNQINLHDRQTPYISALVIKNHVRDGVELAKEHNLPPCIIDVIKQHHGTTLVHYFYEKAKREFLDTIDTTNMSRDEMQSLATEKIDAATFRYDGPRPRNKESLIIMLADSMEAASRTMKRVTPQTIEALVDNIFDIKLNDHQLDECPIALNEVRKLKKVFASVMLAMMHARISYAPATESGNDSQKDGNG
jgi:putative nucleotidyltransferase with HDIG domain